VLGTAEVYGEGRFGQLGAAVAVEIDTTEELALPTRGLRFDLAGTLYPTVWDVDSTFGKVFADARVFLAPTGSWQPTLVLAAGGQKVFGDAPYFESAFLGGRARLGRYEPGGQGAVRGLRPQRYAGDASLYGNADLYLPVTRASFLGIPLQFGLHGFADAGRVYVEGESSDTWHHGLGGGLYFASPGRRNLFSFTLARSEGRTAFYLRTGFAF
jgi:outer membrane protein assembly factor BamA